MEKKYSVEISPKTLILGALITISIFILIKLQSVLILIFLAFSISSMLGPIVLYLQKKKIPKTLSIIIIYILFFTVIIGGTILISKPIAEQMSAFSQSLPRLITNIFEDIGERFPIIKEKLNWEEFVDDIQDSFLASNDISSFTSPIASGLKEALGLVGTVFTFLINFFAVIVLSIYFLQLQKKSKSRLFKLISPKNYKKISNMIIKIEEKLGSWLRSQILLMLIIGILGWIGPQVINLPYAIPLGIISGLLEIIPNVGPTVTWIIAIIIVTGGQAPLWQIIFIAVWFILIQQIENYFIVPKLMQKRIGLNPIITIIAILSAGKLIGPIGTLLAVPLVATLQIIVYEYFEQKKDG